MDTHTHIHTYIHTHRTTTVTLAAHARRGLIRSRVGLIVYKDLGGCSVGNVAQWWSACFACERSWVQLPASPLFFCKIIITLGSPAKAELVLLCKRMLFSWGCSSVVERLLRMREVLGSTPSISTFCKIIITLGFSPPAKAELVLMCKRMMLFSWGCSSVVE